MTDWFDWSQPVYIYENMYVCVYVCARPCACVAQLMLAESFCAVNHDILIVKSGFAGWQTSICQRPSLFSTLPGTFVHSHTHTRTYIISSAVFWQILWILGISVLKKFASQPLIHNVLCAFLQAEKKKNKWEELQMIQLNWYCAQQNWEQMQFGSCSCDLIISYLPTPPPFLEFKNNYDIIANLEIPRYAVNTLCLIECSFPRFRNGTLLKMHTHTQKII